jgi:hypothetical protein
MGVLDTGRISPDTVVNKIDGLNLDANSINEVFEAVAKQQFPDSHDWRQRGMNTRWGQQLLAKSVSAHRTAMIQRNPLGNNAFDDVQKRITDEGRHDHASGGLPRSDNSGRREQTGASLSPPTPPNGEYEDSYDSFKRAVRAYQKEHGVDVDRALDMVGSAYHRREKAVKEGSGGASTKFKEFAASL